MIIHFFRQRGQVDWLEISAEAVQRVKDSKAGDVFEYRELHTETQLDLANIRQVVWQGGNEVSVFFRSRRAANLFEQQIREILE